MARYRRDPEYRAKTIARNAAWAKTEKGKAATARKRQRNPLIALKKELGKCSRCGYDKCLAALHWHHLDPSMKATAQWQSQSREKIIKELVHCVLLCANCHVEVHEGIE